MSDSQVGGFEVHGFKINPSGLRIVEVEFPGDYSVEELDPFLERLREYLLKRARAEFKLRVDVRQVSGTNALTRKRLGEFFREMGAHFERNCKSMAIIARNSLQQGAITAVFWLRPKAWDTKIFTSLSSADTWLATGVSDGD